MKEIDLGNLFETVFAKLLELEKTNGVTVKSFTYRDSKFDIELSDLAIKYNKLENDGTPSS
jgi:hypothetical protein